MLGLPAVLPTGFAAETPAANAGVTPRAASVQPRDSTQDILKRMTEELKLTEDQQKKVKQVLDAHEQKIRMILANTNHTPQEVGTKGREVRAANDKQLREVLTAGQYQQWQKIQAQRVIRRRPEAPPGSASPSKTGPSQIDGVPAQSK